MPPGQRLLRAVALAVVLSVLIPSLKGYWGGDEPAQSKEAMKMVKLNPPFELTTALPGLQKELKSLDKVDTNIPGVFAIEIESGKYVEFNGNRPYPAASLIKVPILISFLRNCDLKKCSMDDELEVTDSVKTSGSGFLQWRKSGTKYTARRTAELMMIYSDNTATNMLIDHLGGKEKLNKNFRVWGLKNTKINNYLVDIEGTNITSPYDLVYLLGRVDHGELISESNREFMYEIMEKCRNRSMLPQGLGPGAKIVHKTGTLGKVLGDAGIVTTADGKRYAVAIQVERKRNDRRANALIREWSELIYNAYEHPRHIVSSRQAESELRSN